MRVKILFVLAMFNCFFSCVSVYPYEYKDRTVWEGQRWRTDREVLYAGPKTMIAKAPKAEQEPIVVKKQLDVDPVEIEVEIGSADIDKEVDGIIIKTWYSEE